MLPLEIELRRILPTVPSRSAGRIIDQHHWRGALTRSIVFSKRLPESAGNQVAGYTQTQRSCCQIIAVGLPPYRTPSLCYLHSLLISTPLMEGCHLEGGLRRRKVFKTTSQDFDQSIMTYAQESVHAWSTSEWQRRVEACWGVKYTPNKGLRMKPRGQRCTWYIKVHITSHRLDRQSLCSEGSKKIYAGPHEGPVESLIRKPPGELVEKDWRMIRPIIVIGQLEFSSGRR